MEDSKSSQQPERNESAASAPKDDETLSGTEFNRLPARQRFSPPIATFLPNDLLAKRFKIARFIARGGMGEVYEAEDLELNEHVALKTVRFEYAEQERTMERFKREIQLARKITHQNICRTFDVFRHAETEADGTTRDVLIVSMELLSGVTLDRRIHEKGKFTTEEALPIVLQLVAGLSAAHRVGVIHRDFKSSNVMLQPSPQNPGGMRVVITDFGLAHTMASTGASLTGSLDIVGTPAYMAPEQLESGEITPATDVYALGIVIFEMLTGKLPFKADTVISAALLRLKEPAPSPKLSVPELDPQWVRVVERCLERVPEQRFAEAEDVGKALQGEVVAPPKISVTTTQPRKNWVPIAAAILVLAVLGYFGFRAMKQGAPAAESASSAPTATDATATRTSIAILGFHSLSEGKDAELLGEMLTDSLWSQLDTDEVRFIAPNLVEDMKHNLGIEGGPQSLSKEQYAKIGNYLGSDVLVTGTFQTSGDAKDQTIDWNIHLIRAKDSGSLGSLTSKGKRSELNAVVTRAGKQIRGALKIKTTATEDARLDASLSSNVDALQYFSEAQEKRRTFDVLSAAKLLQKSVAADPSFAQAHSALAESWADLGYEAKAQDEAKKAFDLGAKLSSEERGLITGRYYEMLHDWTKAVENYSSLWTLYNDEPDYGLLLAKSQISAGKGQAALTTLAQVRKRTLSAGMQAQVDLAEANAQQSLANYSQQLASATTAADQAQALKANLLLARARIQQCWALINLGQLQKAKPLCEEARNLNQAAGDQMGTARSINVIANIAYQQGDIPGAVQLFNQALGISQSIGDKADESGALNNIANMTDPNRSPEETQKMYEASVRVATERGDNNGLALAEQNLAAFLYTKGDRVGGKAMFEKAIKLSREIGDKRTEARALNNLCSFKLSSGDVKQALKDCQESLKLRVEIDDKGDIARSLANRGDVLLAQGDIAAAKKDYEDALKIRKDLEQKDDAAYLAISLGGVALQEKQFNVAKQSLGGAVTELATEKDADGEATGRTAMAEVALESGDLAEARKQIDQALKLSQQSQDPTVKLSAAIMDARVEAREGKAAEASKALQAAEKKARASGLVALELQARLARGEAEVKAGNAGSGRAILTAVAQDARVKGFGLIAKKASGAE
jgi:serine/threonine protein kinase/tetratricopeptide (TPR) repeat protein